MSPTLPKKSHRDVTQLAFPQEEGLYGGAGRTGHRPLSRPRTNQAGTDMETVGTVAWLQGASTPTAMAQQA